MTEYDRWLPLNRLEVAAPDAFAKGSLILGPKHSKEQQQWPVAIRVDKNYVVAITSWYNGHYPRGTVFTLDGLEIVYGIRAADTWHAELVFDVCAPLLPEPDSGMVRGLIGLGNSGIFLHGAEGGNHRMVEALIDFRTWEFQERKKGYPTSWIDDWRLALRFDTGERILIEPGLR